MKKKKIPGLDGYEMFHFQIQNPDYRQRWDDVPPRTKIMRLGDAHTLAQRCSRLFKTEVRRTRGLGHIGLLNGTYYSNGRAN